MEVASAGRPPHIGSVKFFASVTIEIEPRNAHSGAHIFDAGLLRDIAKGAVAVVAIKIFAAEIVDHVQVRPRLAGLAAVVAPAATKTEAGVVLIQTGLFGDVAKGSITIVAQQEIGRTVLRVVVRHRIAILVVALVISVEAEINVQPAVAIIVGNGRAGKSSLRRSCELEGVRLQTEFSQSLVAEKQRATGPNDDQILRPAVI